MVDIKDLETFGRVIFIISGLSGKLPVYSDS
jgi:hypothetical protein